MWFFDFPRGANSQLPFFFLNFLYASAAAAAVVVVVVDC